MNEEKLKGKNILISGASSFIGKNLVLRLIGEGANFTTIGRKPSQNIQNIEVDFLKQEPPFLGDLKFDYFVHLAAFSSPARSINEEEVIKLNVDITYNLFNELLRKHIKKCIFMSTSAVYASKESLLSEDSPIRANPDLYSRSKILAEQKLMDLSSKGWPILIYRLANGYGPYQGWRKEETPTLIPQLIADALIKKEMVVFNETPIRDFIYVGDIVESIIRGLKTDYTGILNLGSGKPTSIGELVKTISNLTNVKAKCLNKVVQDPSTRVLDMSLTSKILKYSPNTSLEIGLKDTIKFYKQVILGETHGDH